MPSLLAVRLKALFRRNKIGPDLVALGKDPFRQRMESLGNRKKYAPAVHGPQALGERYFQGFRPAAV